MAAPPRSSAASSPRRSASSYFGSAELLLALLERLLALDPILDLLGLLLTPLELGRRARRRCRCGSARLGGRQVEPVGDRETTGSAVDEAVDRPAVWAACPERAGGPMRFEHSAG